jgi:hypothetical protein
MSMPIEDVLVLDVDEGRVTVAGAPPLTLTVQLLQRSSVSRVPPLHAASV